MKPNKTIRDLINVLIDSKLNKERFYLELGIVESVNEADQTFVFIPNGGDVKDDVNMSVVDGTASVIVPKVYTTVLIGYIDKSEKYCLAVKETDKIFFRDGANGGLINISDQVTKLNKLKIEVQAELIKIQTAITGVGGAYVPGTLSAFSKSDFEDTNITH